MNPTTSPETSAPLTPAMRDQLVTQHMPLVAHLVREALVRVPGHVERDDLTSAGLFALAQAALAFDATRGVPFAAYASTRVRGAILDELRGFDWASRSVRRTARTIERTRSELATALGRVPSTAEIASVMGVGVDEIARNDEDTARAQVLSLHASEDSELEGLLPTAGPTPEQVVEHRERLTYMIEAVTELPERLRVVVEGYFLAERPMAEIAAELGVSESRISQMRAEALVLLRGALNRALDPDLEPVPATVAGCAERRREAYYAAVSARHTAALRPVRHHRLNETA